MAKILIKNGQNGCFLKSYGQNHEIFNYGNFHIHRSLKFFGRQYTLFFATKCGFAKEASFYLRGRP